MRRGYSTSAGSLSSPPNCCNGGSIPASTPSKLTSALGSRPGTRIPGRSCGPRPLMRSLAPSPDIVNESQTQDTSAFFPSPFERAAVLTLDRGGDFLSTTLQVGAGSRLDRLAEVRNPDSLGEVYSALTWYLGFEPNADEGKTMGLAPYGTDKLAGELAELVQRTPDGLFRVNLAWFTYHREGGWLSRQFLDRYGPPRTPESAITERHQDLAFAAQDLLEETALHLARTLRRRSGQANLCLAGGVALNSVMNTRLLREAGFERI